MVRIINPILPGFNPDPSILRVHDDYYIATSTFEWFPGVRIHRSRDLVHWKLISMPLDRLSQLDMKGTPDSTGVWAPCLSFSDGLFFLVYTNVKGHNAGLTAHNYLVTAPGITGPWSEPIYLNSIGFDPSLFHDENGRKWLVAASCDHGQGRSWFGGIVLQEYSFENKKLIGPSRVIFAGTTLGSTEGPHLYKRGDYYYLLTAEGGTSFSHAVTLARSKQIEGPYEVHPENPILTSRPYIFDTLQKSGHASIVETQKGETYLAHLSSRPLPPYGRSVLGRETCLQKMVWNSDGWLRLEVGENRPQISVTAPALQPYPWPCEPIRYEFDCSKLPMQFQTLRVPLGMEIVSLTERPGWLRIKGKESLGSLFLQTLVALRQNSFRFIASTCMEFEPKTFQHMARIVYYYNTQNYHYLYVSRDENLGKCIGITTCDNLKYFYHSTTKISIEGWARCYLQVQVNYDVLRFYFSPDGKSWNAIGLELDATILSDEHYATFMNFTGAFVGISCQDLAGNDIPAYFQYFEYQSIFDEEIDTKSEIDLR